jgi:aquaporin Z
MGAVSGAHVNPAVTIAFAVRGNFQWWRVPGYLVAQFPGAIAAAFFLRGMFGIVGDLGATAPREHVSSIQALVMEAVLTAGLVNTILGTASGARNIGTNAGIAVGAYIALAGMWAAPISGASMNLARSVGPESGERRFAHDPDLYRRSAAGRARRGDIRMDPERAPDPRRNDRRSGRRELSEHSRKYGLSA